MFEVNITYFMRTLVKIISERKMMNFLKYCFTLLFLIAILYSTSSCSKDSQTKSGEISIEDLYARYNVTLSDSGLISADFLNASLEDIKLILGSAYKTNLHITDNFKKGIIQEVRMSTLDHVLELLAQNHQVDFFREGNVILLGPQGRFKGPEWIAKSEPYEGKLISFDFYDSSLETIFKIFNEIRGEQYVAYADVKERKFTMRLLDVPNDQALLLILKLNNLGIQKKEGTNYVYSKSI